MGRFAVLSACLVLAALWAPTALPGGPLETAFVAGSDFTGPDADLAFGRAREAGTRLIRINAWWAQIAAARPADGSDPRDPANPAYDWSVLDAAVTRATANNLVPIVGLLDAPKWAWGRATGGGVGEGPIQPSVEAFGDFAAAAAERYSGRQGLPRVRYWLVWNEPNLSTYLRPQYAMGKSASPAWYREMVNAASDAVHAANPTNSVIAGALSAFTVKNANYVSIGPLRFMRELLCMSAGERPAPTCNKPVRFDIWAHHPYTSGGPTHEALNPDDVSLGDLPEMKRLLDAAVRARRITSGQKMRFWVTEFSWDSRPPDPKGVPASLHARWVSEALYRMWQNGVSLVTWFNLRDEPFVDPYYCQCGLWLRGQKGMASDVAKLSLRAFRFPFVAFSRPDGRVSVWGRTPTSAATPVRIEQRLGTKWVALTAARPGRKGIFLVTVPSATANSLRARVTVTGETSVPFSLKQPPDLPICAFGTC